MSVCFLPFDGDIVAGKESNSPGIGLVNRSCIGLIGSGVVVHIPSLFAELDALQAQGASPPKVSKYTLRNPNNLDVAQASTVLADYSSQTVPNLYLTSTKLSTD